MKRIYLLIIGLFVAFGTNAQWSVTNAAPAFPNEIIYDLQQHENRLYAATNNRGLIRYNGTGWDSIGFTGFTINPNSIHIEALGSAENYLYAVVQNQSCAQSEVYRSADSGLTFTIDTIGLPRFNCPIGNQSLVMNINRIYSLDDHLIAIINGGNYIKKPGTNNWNAISDSKVMLAEYFGSRNGTWYAYNTNSGYNLHLSVDSGATWTTPSNTNLPPLWQTKALSVNKSSGRIYMGGRSLSQQVEQILYTDNEGTSWDSLNFSQYVGTNFANVQQNILDIYSNGDTVIVNMDNNQSGTRIDILLSDDKGASFKHDTIGLAVDAFGTGRSKGIVEFNGAIYLPASFTDIYKKGLSTNSTKFTTTSKATIYPNPTRGKIYLGSKEKIKNLYLYDLNGKLLDVKIGGDNSIDVSDFHIGQYFLYVEYWNGSGQIGKFMKY